MKIGLFIVKGGTKTGPIRWELPWPFIPAMGDVIRIPSDSDKNDVWVVVTRRAFDMRYNVMSVECTAVDDMT